MSERPNNRVPRRLQVKFWRHGEPDRASVGYTTNISPTGMFVSSSTPLAPGSAIEVELQNPRGAVQVSGEVVHSARVSPVLQRVRSSGMGIRFHRPHPKMVEVLLGDLSPEVLREAAMAAPSAGMQESAQGPPPGATVFQVDLTDPEQFRAAFQRHIQHGELEVLADTPPSVGTAVWVAVGLPGTASPLHLEGKVVRARPGPLQPDGKNRSLVAVALRNSAETVRRLRAYL